MEEICGPNVFSPNVHSLNHLSWQVKKYGPLWCTSAIMFESANYILKTKFTGTVNHLRLIVERYNRNKKIRKEMPANDALFGFCQKLRKERETMQPSLRVPTVLSTCKMEKTFFDSLRVKNFNIHSFQKNEHNACISFIRDGTAVYGLVELFYSARDVNYAIVSTFKILKTEKPEKSVRTFSPILKSSCLENNLNVLLLKFPEKWSKFCITQKLSSPHC